jgi:hypothetical protein
METGRTTFYTCFLALFELTLCCCNDNLIESTRQVSLPPFHTLIMNGTFSIYLIQDTVYSVKIVGMGDVPNEVSATVQNDSLTFVNNAKGKWLHPETNKVKLYISSNNLGQILANETCYFETVNPIASSLGIIMGASVKLTEANLQLNCGSFNYWNNYQCGGKINLSGTVKSLTINSFAIMTIDASNLIATDAYVQNNSKGDCSVYVTDALEYSIGGTGNIYLSGDPKEIVLVQKSSTGQLIRK